MAKNSQNTLLFNTHRPQPPHTHHTTQQHITKLFQWVVALDSNDLQPITLLICGTMKNGLAICPSEDLEMHVESEHVWSTVDWIHWKRKQETAAWVEELTAAQRSYFIQNYSWNAVTHPICQYFRSHFREERNKLEPHRLHFRCILASVYLKKKIKSKGFQHKL